MRMCYTTPPADETSMSSSPACTGTTCVGVHGVRACMQTLKTLLERVCDVRPTRRTRELCLYPQWKHCSRPMCLVCTRLLRNGVHGCQVRSSSSFSVRIRNNSAWVFIKFDSGFRTPLLPSLLKDMSQ
eukprot:scpid11952/ scgid1848/ 